MQTKNYLSPGEAVEAGYFSSLKQAAALRWEKKGPKFYKPTKGRVVYSKEDLEQWVRTAVVQTIDSLPWEQRNGAPRW